MVVHFIASKGNILEDYKYYKRITETILDQGHELALDWMTKTYQLAKERKLSSAQVDWKKIYDQNMKALSLSDAVIAEATAGNFSTGCQVSTAIHQKKPVLMLTRDNMLKNTFGSGVSSDLVVYTDYTDDELESTVTDFLYKNNVTTKDLRFNLFIDRKIHNYLRWASYKTGKNKSEIIRDLINKEIENYE